MVQQIQEIALDKSEFELPFGKHKGVKLKDVPQTYLIYMYTEFEPGNTWKTNAENELKRRAHVAKYGSDAPECLFQAVEEISKTNLLREFLTRSDRSLGIFAWCCEFSKEVKRYGKKQSGVCWHYLGYGFGYDVIENKKVLRSVWKVKDAD